MLVHHDGSMMRGRKQEKKNYSHLIACSQSVLTLCLRIQNDKLSL